MPVNGKVEKITEDGAERDALVVTFTNGAKEQIAELKTFFKQPDDLELVKLGISLLQNIKEQEDKKKQST